MIKLHSTPSLLLAVLGMGCGLPGGDLPPGGGDSGTTEAVDPSSGSPVTMTSTTTATSTATATSTSTSSPTTTDTDGTADDETGRLFLVVPDGGPCVASGDEYWHCSYCDVATQNCPDGEKCVPWANDGGGEWNATRCSPLPERPAGLGEPCVVEDGPASGFDDCGLGALCWGVDPRTLEGTCVELCDAYDDSCGAGSVCVDYDYFAPYVCMPRCDPLDPGTCAADESCRVIGGDALCVPTIVLPEGLSCAADDQFCGADQTCLGATELAACGEVECCTAWCDLSAADPDLPCTQPGEACRPFFEDGAPTGYDHVGVCGLPL